MGLGFVAGVESSEAAEPGVGAFDDPAVSGLGVAAAGDAFAAAGAGSLCLPGEVGFAWSASAADHWFDAAFADSVPEWVAAVAAVAPELAGEVAVGDQLVEERERVCALVFVAGPEPDPDRPAVCFDGEVVLARGAAPVYRAGAGELTPFFASISEASITTRDQSSLPARLSSLMSSTIAFSHTPFSIHSCRRFRHVSPLGNPSSRGTSMYRQPVYSRYKIPSRHARAGSRLRPGLRGRLGGSASKGASSDQT